jgi:Fe-S cluster assembly iron-binding protein IscA
MGDQVVDRDEATVWLAPTAAEALDNTELDEGGDDEGHIQRYALGQRA